MRSRLVPVCLIAAVVISICDGSSSSGSSSGTPPAAASTLQLPTPLLRLTERFGAWWAVRGQQPLHIEQYLPAARPHQPWPYRTLDSAVYSSVTLSDSYALQASVTHAPLKGVTSEMLAWWFNNMEGDALYAGDGQVWSKYLQWHPRDHIMQRSVPDAAAGSSASKHAARSLWEICEFFLCPEPAGYTTANYQPGGQHSSEWVIKEVTQVHHLGANSLVLTVPSAPGRVPGTSLWQLQHHWHDSPLGLVVQSSQTVGVVDIQWRPLWFARWRNALVRGMFGRGRDPVWMLQQWLVHCVEEIGNLEHILPGLYAGGDSGRDISAVQPLQHEDVPLQYEDVPLQHEDVPLQHEEL